MNEEKMEHMNSDCESCSELRGAIFDLQQEVDEWKQKYRVEHNSHSLSKDLLLHQEQIIDELEAENDEHKKEISDGEEIIQELTTAAVQKCQSCELLKAKSAQASEALAKLSGWMAAADAFAVEVKELQKKNDTQKETIKHYQERCEFLEEKNKMLNALVQD